MPALQPPDIWQQSGRYETMRRRAFKVRDRAKKEWVHRAHRTRKSSPPWPPARSNSYRQMPMNFYQVSVKFRDEIRPPLRPDARQGVHHEGRLQLRRDATRRRMVSYQKMYDAYKRIFRPLRAEELSRRSGHRASSAAITRTSSWSPAETGENEVVYCEGCGYAANVEKAASGIPKNRRAIEDGAAVEKFATPGRCDHRGLTRRRTASPANPPDQDAGLSPTANRC